VEGWAAGNPGGVGWAASGGQRPGGWRGVETSPVWS
jgi:hypothetical protein